VSEGSLMTQGASTAQASWQPANNGAGKRRWFLIREDENLPVSERYYYDAGGKLARYASCEAAQAAADKLNRPLTERRKGDRAQLARAVAELAGRYGLSARVVSAEHERPRAMFVHLAGPHGLMLTVPFRARSPHTRPDTYVLSWYGVESGWWLHPHAFGGSVNPCHGRKATDGAHSTRELLALLERRFAAIADGSAFRRHTERGWASA
jgi:hypothetical protein